MLCCKCGAELIIRTNSQTGEKFYGCSNYPTCSYTEPFEPTSSDKHPDSFYREVAQATGINDDRQTDILFDKF